MSLSIHGVKIWSSIGEDVKRCKTIHSFKSNGKTLLPSQYSEIPVFVVITMSLFFLFV